VMNIAVQNDRQWQLLCEVLGLDDLAHGDRLTKNSARLQHRDEVEVAVANAVSTWSPAELAVALDRAGIPWGLLNQTADVARHPQLEAGQRWRVVDLPNGDSVSVLTPPFRFARGELHGDRPRVPALGEHTREVFEELTNEKEVHHG